MYIDFRMADVPILDSEGPALVKVGTACWQLGSDVNDKKSLTVLVDQMWEAIERSKRDHELQAGSQAH